jgi:outer membrane protein assembly factor BamB
MKLQLSYPAVLLTSVVAGLFSLIVGLSLAVHLVRRGTLELFDDPTYQTLQEEFASQPGNDELRQTIRDLDLQQRNDYFRSRQFVKTGAILLVGGLILTLITARWSVALRPVLPHPEAGDDSRDWETWQQRRGRWAAATVITVLVLGLVYMGFRSQTKLSPAVAEVDGTSVVNPAADSHPEGAASNAEVAEDAPEAIELPSAEEYNRQWPRFRGPTGSGIAATPDAPTTWDIETGQGVLWKTEIPLPGRNSAVVWEQHVFVTGATAKQQTIYCLNADTGEFRWQYDFPPPQVSEEEFEVSESTGYAAPTMATDGVRAFAIFASGDLVAVDFEGRELWHKRLGIPDNPYGYANSLATYQGLLIVQNDQGSGRDGKSRLYGLDSATGDVVWEVPRAMPSGWASPIVVEHEGEPMLITCAAPWTIAYSPTDGREIWKVECLDADVGPSPVYSRGIVFVANETGGMTAIRASGEGDITETNVVWTTDITIPDTSSPLVTDQFLILLAHGYMACFDREGSSEEPLWEEDIVDEANSSPGLAGDLIYIFTADGNALILKPSVESCERVAELEMGEPCHASPAFHQGRIYIRGEQHLFCLTGDGNSEETE